MNSTHQRLGLRRPGIGLRRLAATVLLMAAAPVAMAQSESLDDLDDLFGPSPSAPSTPGQEREALLRETDAPDESLLTQPTKRRVIQTLQRKNFMKIGRYEAAPHLGFVTNDPFINRYLLGASFAYHVTEVFAVEVSGTFSPDLGQGDWKPITQQIVNENQVTPDISKIQFYSHIDFQYSPIYGKVAVMGKRIINFDMFGVIGTGVVSTRDDLEALQNNTPVATATESQLHPTLNYGGGLRVIFSQSFALRIEGRGLSYIETLESRTLEMKNNMTLLAGVSFFFPGMN